ncbi:hypothetical protein BC831DRAFT_548296 [Entophlyctis helioformis]|nr:hypothetical protein BC831DRAFT_548296 [Entophlyctis helioformis]
MASAVTVLVLLVLLALFGRYILFGGRPPAAGAGARAAGPSGSGTGTPRTAATPRRRGRHPVRADQVDTVLSMFPAFQRASIELDLSHTGSVDATIERILSGALVPVRAPAPCLAHTAIQPSSRSTHSAHRQPPPPPAPVAQQASAHASPVTQHKPSPYLTSVGQPPVAEPPKKWEASPEARQSNLRQRKEFMVQEARRWGGCCVVHRLSCLCRCWSALTRLRARVGWHRRFLEAQAKETAQS